MISFGFCMSTQLLKYKIDPVGSCPGNAIGISKKKTNEIKLPIDF